MDGFLGGIDIVAEGRLAAFFLEGDFVACWVVGHFDGVSGGELEGLVLAIELHLVSVPGVAVRTDEVVSMVRVGVAEIEVDSFDGVEVRNSNSNP